MRATWAVVAATLAVLTACGQSSPGASADRPCTKRAGGDLVGVRVDADVAPIRALALTICADGTCRDERVGLMAGSTTVDDGTQFSYLTMPLTEAALEVSGHYRVGGREVDLAATTIATTASYPNGPDCGTDGFQTSITIGSTGLR